jgi:hypothetical protein
MSKIKNKLKINQEYLSNKLDIERKMYDLLHPYMVDDNGDIWEVEEFNILGFKAVRRKDDVFACFNSLGELVEHRYEYGDGIDGVKIDRELTPYEVKKYDNMDHIECFFRKEPPVFVMTSREKKRQEEKLENMPQFLKDLHKHLDENPLLDKELEELTGSKRSFTAEQIGDILDRILFFLDNADHNNLDDDQNIFIDDTAFLYVDGDNMEDYGFTETELCGALNDLYMEAEEEGVLESNYKVTHGGTGFSFYHNGRRLQICQFVGQGSFYRLEILERNIGTE